ncbi:MAG: DMT family transporter [Candidatus Aenigmarchaeota archaeon]|nr:DMT family transporter [Candidatus Aenigmarchaeota archaeon]
MRAKRSVRATDSRRPVGEKSSASPPRKEAVGTLLALLTAVVSGISIPLNKLFLVPLDPAVFTAVRAIIIGVVFLAVSRWRGIRAPAGSWKPLLVIALLGGALAFLLFFTGLKLTTAGRAGFLHKTLPLYVAVLGFLFLKERLNRRFLLGMLLLFLGTIAIYFTQITPAALWLDPQLGDALIVGATVLWAVENVAAKGVMNRGAHALVVQVARMLYGGLILMGVVLLTGRGEALLALSGGQLVNIAISTVLLLAYVAFYYAALQRINVSKAAALLLLAPVISLGTGMAFLGEPAPLLQLAGSGVILAGAYLLARQPSEQRGV